MMHLAREEISNIHCIMDTEHLIAEYNSTRVVVLTVYFCISQTNFDYNKDLVKTFFRLVIQNKETVVFEVLDIENFGI